MKNLNKLRTVILCISIISSPVIAKDNWVSTNDKPVRDSAGNCVRNGVWTPATAHPECAPDITPKPQAIQVPKTLPNIVVPTPAPAAPIPSTTKTTTKITMQAETLFDFDKSTIKPEGRQMLNGFITSLNGTQTKYDIVIVIGHTDSIGSDAYNMKLGMRRAQAVKAYLISNGIEANKIQTLSKGEREPVADNRSAAGRAKNRRVVVEVVGIK